MKGNYLVKIQDTYCNMNTYRNMNTYHNMNTYRNMNTYCNMNTGLDGNDDGFLHTLSQTRGVKRCLTFISNDEKHVEKKVFCYRNEQSCLYLLTMVLLGTKNGKLCVLMKVCSPQLRNTKGWHATVSPNICQRTIIVYAHAAMQKI